MLTRSCSLLHSPDTLEISVNTFRFSWPTKRGMQAVFPRLPGARLHLAMTIQGNANEELPEQTFWAARIHKIEVGSLQTHDQLPALSAS